MTEIGSKRPLRKSGVAVSPVIFGAWAIGGWMWGGTNEKDAIAAIQASVDRGLDTIDTAPSYGFGLSEELVGTAIAGRRDKIVLATKCGVRWDSEVGNDPSPQTLLDGTPVVMRKNSRPDSIVYECEQSLRRLRTDVIDLYQIHWPDISTPVEDSIGAMERLREQGKIRAIGVSNFSRALLERAVAVAPIASVQPPYSLLTRGFERDTMPYCREHDIAAICYSPMERGLLTGAVAPDRQFAANDHRASLPNFTVEMRQKVLGALDRVRPIAARHGATFAQLVINWTIQAPGITAAIVGARTPDQAISNAGALRFQLSPDECAAIRRAFDALAT